MHERAGSLGGIRTVTRCLRFLALAALIPVPSGASQGSGAMWQATPAANDAPVLADGVEFFVDPNSNARKQSNEWRSSRPDDAAAMERIAGQPQADWFGGWTPDIRARIDARVTEITETGALPILVAYNIPYRDCGQYSAGGENDPESYRVWVRAFAEGIGDRPALVILEPDGLTLTDCLDEAQTAERFELLRFAVDTFEANPNVDVYIDAGHSNWLPPEEAARRLQLAGIDRAAGFSLNVSNFQRTDDLIAYGKAVSDAIGAEDGTHFVIDTSRNGNGPWESDAPEAWCNPPGRALGEAPTVDTADPLVDAYLWIKRPGESDGSCRGAPEAGAWYPEYALGLALNVEDPDAIPAASPVASPVPGNATPASQG